MTKVEELESKWQKFWREQHTFETSKNDKEKFFGTVAYPYANSVLHIGHGRTYTTADIYLKFQRILGKNVLFPMGFHISGTPVLAVADAIKQGDEKQISITREAISEYVEDSQEVENILESFKDPQQIADFFSKTIANSFEKVGIGIDWRRQFSTGDEIYTKFIDWQFRKLHNLEILTQGKYPILYSALEENAVGEDDIKDGDIDKVSISEMTYILFERKDHIGEFYVVTTLRPDALFGTTNLWMNKDFDIVKVKVQNQVWIITKEALVKVQHQFDDVEVLSEHKGQEFIGDIAITPLISREVQVAQADFLDPHHGTGVVYSSPAGSPHDFMALQEAKSDGRLPKDLEVPITVDTFDKKKERIVYSGSCPAEDKILKYAISSSTDPKLETVKQELYKEEHYGGVLNDLCGEFSGLPIKKAKSLIEDKLKELELAGVFLETSRRAVTRSGDRVIVANLEGQWFLDYSDAEVKMKALKLLEDMNYLPAKLKETQKGYINWVEKRPCARKRGLGSPLPYDKGWIVEPLSDSTIYQVLYSIMHIIEREKLPFSALSEEVFDYLYLNESLLKQAQKVSGISKEVLVEMREEAQYWNGCDLRYVGQPHMSNHLSFLIYHYALIFDEHKEFFPKTGVVGGMLMRNGEKISKSKGNGIPLSKVSKEFGADLYRLYIATAASFDVPMDFRDEEIDQLSKKFDKFRDIMIETSKAEKKQELTSTNKWLLSKFQTYLKEYLEAMEEMKIRESYVGVFFEFLNDVTYHMRRTSEDETYGVLAYIFEDYLKVMAPTTPHLCEELFALVKPKREDSIFNLEALGVNESLIDLEALEEEQIVHTLVSEIARVKESKQNETFSKVILVQAKQERFELFDSLKELLSNTNNTRNQKSSGQVEKKSSVSFKEIMGTLSKDFSEDKKFISKFVPKTLGSGLSFYLPQQEEKELFISLTEYVTQEFGLELEVKSQEEYEVQFQNTMPTKPQVLLE